MSSELLPDEIAALLKSVKSRRAKIVIEHIVKHGFVTTEELEKIYGYKHPPRAARDVREAGIPLETFRVRASNGRWIAAYRLGDVSDIIAGRAGGRETIPKAVKRELYSKSGGRCAICYAHFELRYLQVDHRVPYEVSGGGKGDPAEFMLLCASCNRAKSWSCEHCANWLSEKSADVCRRCYWADPESYTHVALLEVRRVDVQWSGEEIEVYERLRRAARDGGFPLPDYVKAIIAKCLNDNKG